MFEHQPLNHFTVVMLGHKFVFWLCVLMNAHSEVLGMSACSVIQEKVNACVNFLFMCADFFVGGRKVSVAGGEEGAACSHTHRLPASY